MYIGVVGVEDPEVGLDDGGKVFGLLVYHVFDDCVCRKF